MSLKEKFDEEVTESTTLKSMREFAKREGVEGQVSWAVGGRNQRKKADVYAELKAVCHGVSVTGEEGELPERNRSWAELDDESPEQQQLQQDAPPEENEILERLGSAESGEDLVALVNYFQLSMVLSAETISAMKADIEKFVNKE